MFNKFFDGQRFRKYQKDIRKRGWTANYSPGDAEHASLSYSAGLSDSLGAPEIIMFGMDPEITCDLIAATYDALKSGQLAFVDMAECRLGWWEGPPKLAWRPVHPSQIREAYFALAAFYRRQQGKPLEGLQAYQLFCSDMFGKFPWEDDYDQTYRPRQPELWRPYEGPAGAN